MRGKKRKKEQKREKEGKRKKNQLKSKNKQIKTKGVWTDALPAQDASGMDVTCPPDPAPYHRTDDSSGYILREVESEPPLSREEQASVSTNTGYSL